MQNVLLACWLIRELLSRPHWKACLCTESCKALSRESFDKGHFQNRFLIGGLKRNWTCLGDENYCQKRILISACTSRVPSPCPPMCQSWGTSQGPCGKPLCLSLFYFMVHLICGTERSTLSDWRYTHFMVSSVPSNVYMCVWYQPHSKCNFIKVNNACCSVSVLTISTPQGCFILCRQLCHQMIYVTLVH